MMSSLIRLKRRGDQSQSHSGGDSSVVSRVNRPSFHHVWVCLDPIGLAAISATEFVTRSQTRLMLLPVEPGAMGVGYR